MRDLATIADVTLAFGEGLNVLTGETGAGKSMLVDALALLLGERADSQLVRPGTNRCVVEGSFEVNDPGILSTIQEFGLDLRPSTLDSRLSTLDSRLSTLKQIVIRREVSTEGRSRAWVNGSPTTMSVLAQVGALLVDLHGQHETQSLLHTESQRNILDAFSGAEAERAAVADAVAVVNRFKEEESDLASRREEVRRRADYLRHVVQEVDAARLKAGEEESLERDTNRLRHAGRLGEQARAVALAMEDEDNGAIRALARAERALGPLEKTDPDTGAWRELLDSAYANLSELARVAADYAGLVQEDPGRLQKLEQRRDTIYRLAQKYGENVAAILETRNSAAAELDLLDTADLDLRNIAARRTGAEAAVKAAAEALTAKRTDAAARLGRMVNRLLPKLGLPVGELIVELTPLPEANSTGQEAIVFMVRLNQGMDARPLARSASGGELSRIMLALKVVLAQHDAVPTLVFDEVDQGIGGEIGTQVAEALASVSARRQVLVITHLAQIGARADHHLLVSKGLKSGMATSDLRVIHGEDRVLELARMLGDADSVEARKHAGAMLKSGNGERGKGNR